MLMWRCCSRRASGAAAAAAGGSAVRLGITAALWDSTVGVCREQR